MTAEGPADRARELADAAQEDPERVDLNELADLLNAQSVEARRAAIEAFRSSLQLDARGFEAVRSGLRDRLTDEDGMVRSAAVMALSDAARVDPDAVADLAPDVIELLDDEPLVQSSAIEFLAQVAPADPEALRPAVPELRSFLADEHSHLHPDVLRCLAAVASIRPDLLATDRDRFIEFFDTEPKGGPVVTSDRTKSRQEFELTEEVRSNAVLRGRNVRLSAGGILVEIARDEPGAVVDRVDDIASNLDDANPSARGVAVDVLGAIADEFPESVEPFLPELLDRLEDDRPIDGKAAIALGALSQSRPEPIIQELGAETAPLADLLDDESPEVRGAAAGLLSHVAEADPDAVESTLEDVRPLLNDEYAYVRGNAVLVLGFADDVTARERVADVAESDPDSNVREAAADVLEHLDG